FLPEVGVVVVAVTLPEAGLVGRTKLEAAQPLRALPEVPRRNHQPQRPAVVRAERLAVGVVSQQRVLVLDRLEREVGGEALLRMGHDETSGRLWLDELRQVAPVHALEACV